MGKVVVDELGRANRARPILLAPLFVVADATAEIAHFGDEAHLSGRGSGVWAGRGKGSDLGVVVHLGWGRHEQTNQAHVALAGPHTRVHLAIHRFSVREVLWDQCCPVLCGDRENGQLVA
jgi:hypothetical protein